jgi:hypothetical protein
MPTLRRARSTLFLCLLGVLGGCGGGGGGGTITPPPPPGPTPLEIGDQAPLWELEDTNPASMSFDTLVGPATRLGFATAWYFAEASSTYAQDQFGLLEQIVTEILTGDPGFRGQALGVNETGEEAGTPTMVAGRTSPWLQDTAQADAWGLWVMDANDLVVLDPFGRVFELFDLDTDDLNDTPSYDAVKQALLDAAAAPPPPPPLVAAK